jgi:hypothetical protein
MKNRFSAVAGTILIALGARSLEARPDGREDLKRAILSLGQSENYSWSVVSRTQDRNDPEIEFRMGAIRGATGKNGLTYLKTELIHEEKEVLLEGAYKEKMRILKTTHFDWLPVLHDGRFSQKGYGGTFKFYFRSLIAHIVANSKRPTEEAEDLLVEIRELKDEGEGIYSGDLSGKALEQMGWRGPGGSPEVDRKGSARFWVKEGRLQKYEYTLGGKRYNRRVVVDRTTTIEITKVGATEVELPPKAKDLLSTP